MKIVTPSPTRHQRRQLIQERLLSNRNRLGTAATTEPIPSIL
jgi:hypothetical protein